MPPADQPRLPLGIVRARFTGRYLFADSISQPIHLRNLAAQLARLMTVLS